MPEIEIRIRALDLASLAPPVDQIVDHRLHDSLDVVEQRGRQHVAQIDETARAILIKLFIADDIANGGLGSHCRTSSVPANTSLPQKSRCIFSTECDSRARALRLAYVAVP